MALNDKRTIPYDFHVFDWQGLVWLVDLSERTFACSLTPCYGVEPLYPLDEPEDWDGFLPDPTYIDCQAVEAIGTIPVDAVDPEDVAPDVEFRDAWDAAREEACANCLI